MCTCKHRSVEKKDIHNKQPIATKMLHQIPTVLIKCSVFMPTNHAFPCFIVCFNVGLEIPQNIADSVDLTLRENIVNITHKGLIFTQSIGGIHQQEA